MNIIYLLTNLTNNKKYIGQKVECRIENLDGINTIINKNYRFIRKHIEINDFNGIIKE